MKSIKAQSFLNYMGGIFILVRLLTKRRKMFKTLVSSRTYNLQFSRALRDRRVHEISDKKINTIYRAFMFVDSMRE